MIRRPNSSESEQDLLALQEEFLSSKISCSTRIHHSNDNTKRRDVVKLDPAIAKPVTTQERKVLTDVKETQSKEVAFQVVPVYSNEVGFPVAVRLNSIDKSKGSKKSLFAEQFDSRSPEEFGITISPLMRSVKAEELKRDTIDPLSIGKRDIITSNDQENVTQFAGTSSETWHRFSTSKFVTGEGLVTPGVPGGVAQKEISKIHEENVTKLSSISEEEILQEQEKLKKMLDPNLLLFLKSRNNSKGSDGGNGREVTQRNDEETLCGIEEKKIEWTTDVKVTNSNSNPIFREIRFSFDGLVIPREVGVALPSELALHHHGDEPESAGYTLEELFILARSSVQQQKVLSIRTLSAISKRARYGEYTGLIEGSPLSVLIESKYPQLLRYLLDETTDSLQAISIYGIHSLLVQPTEERFVSVFSNGTLCCYLPSLAPPIIREGVKEGVDEVMQCDVITGLLKMMLLPRLRYILEVCHPQKAVVINILEILIQISRHSSQSANEILKCPRLVTFIFETFLPITFSHRTSGDIYNRPHPLAMKLMFHLCKSGRHISKEMVSSHQLLTRLIPYVLVPPTDHTHLTDDESRCLAIEATRTWTVLLGYGLTNETLSDTMTTILKSFFSFSSPFTLSPYELQSKTSLFQLFSVAVLNAGTTYSTLKGVPICPSSSIDWTQIKGVVDPSYNWLTNVLEEYSTLNHKELSLDIVQYISGLLYIVTSFYVQCYCKPELRHDPVSLLQNVQLVYTGVVEVFLRSKLYHSLLSKLKSVIAVSFSTNSTHCSSLPLYITLHSSRQALYNKDPLQNKDRLLLVEPHCLLLTYSDLLSVFYQLCYSLTQLHHGLNVLSVILCEEFWELIKEVTNTTTFTVSAAIYPLYLMLFYIIKILLSSDATLLSSQLCLIHSLSLLLLSITPPGYEYCYNELLNTVIFHPSFYKDIQENPVPSDSLPFISTQVTTPTLITDSLKSLPSIKETYFNYCGIQGKGVARSNHWLTRDPINQDTMLLPSLTSFIASFDWPYQPLITQYTAAIVNRSSDEDLISLCHCLEFLLILEHYRFNVFRYTPTVSKRLVYIMSTFLISSDVFFDSLVRPCLSSLFVSFARHSILSKLDFTLQTFSHQSFNDFYTSLLDQYSAVSYGDQLFGLYLFFPLQQKHSVTFRRNFWIDHFHILRLISCTSEQLIIPLELFLYPVEEDSMLLEQYKGVIFSGDVCEKRNLILYKIAVHHSQTR